MSRRATNITIIDQALVSGTNFITGLALARFLGMEAYGTFVLLSGVILFASNIQNAIIISPMMVNGPGKELEEAKQYYRDTCMLQIVTTLLFFVAIVVLGNVLDHTLLNNRIGSLVIPLALATSGLIMQEYFRRYFFSTNNSNHALINDIISYGLQFGGVVGLHFIGSLNVVTCLYVMAYTSFIAVLHGYVISRLPVIPPITKYSKIKQKIKIHWDFGKWLLARNIAYWMGTQSIIYTAGILLSLSAVGAMGATRNIVGFINILFLALDNFATPRAAVAYSRGGCVALKKYITRILTIGGTITIFATGIVSAFSDILMNMIYSSQYVGFEWIVQAWAIFFMVGYFQRPVGIALRTMKLTKSLFFGTTAGTLTAAIVCYPAIKLWGINGAMAALIGTQATISTYYYLSMKRIYKLKIN